MSQKATPVPKDQVAELSPTPDIIPEPAPEPALPATIKSPTDAAFENLVFEDDDASEKPAPVKPVTPEPGKEVDPNDPNAAVITTEVDPDAPVLMFGDEVLPAAVATAAPPAAETPAEKQLREQNEALIKRLAELEAGQPVATTTAPLVKPELWDTGIDGDQTKHEEALEQYYEQRASQKIQAQQAERVLIAARTHDQSVRTAASERMDQQLRAAITTFPDILQADDALGKVFADTPGHAMAFLDADLPNPEMVAYALHKKPELLAAYLKERNPVRLGKMLNDISAKVHLAPKAAAPEVNNAPEVKGSIGQTADQAFAKEFPGATFE